LRLFRQIEDRLPALGDLGGQLDVLRPERGDEYRNAFPHRIIDELERLTQSGALVGWQRDGVVLALVLQGLSAPDLAADVDDFAGAGYRGVVGHAVEALDDLRTGGAKTEGEPAVGDIVQASRGHRRQRGRPGVKLQNARRQLYPFRAGRKVAQRADRIERIRLGDKDNV
jgi:hypothetical protein